MERKKFSDFIGMTMLEKNGSNYMMIEYYITKAKSSLKNAIEWAGDLPKSEAKTKILSNLNELKKEIGLIENENKKASTLI